MDDSGIFFLVYSSRASRPMSEPELVQLLAKCRENNQALDISGMLLHKDGNFLQVLEGEEQAVCELYSKVALDQRHEELRIVQRGFIPKREFPDWTMGFQNLDEAEIARTPGYTPFLNSSMTAADFKDDPPSAKRLLLLFKAGKAKAAGAGR